MFATIKVTRATLGKIMHAVTAMTTWLSYHPASSFLPGSVGAIVGEGEGRDCCVTMQTRQVE